MTVSFRRSVATLMTGTAAGQAILLVALPLLTRIYSPEDFSVLAVYVSAVSILSISACARLEIAIPLPVDDVEAASLLVLALATAFTVSMLVLVAVLAFPSMAEPVIPELSPFLWLLPLGIWCSASYAALQYWSTRKRRFGDVARTRLVQAIGGVSTQVGAGLMGFTPLGLLVGHVVTSGAGVFGLAAHLIRNERSALSSVRTESLRNALRQYRRFPTFSAFDALVNTAGLQLPVVIIAAFAVGPEAGLLLLAMRTVQAPMGLMGTSVGQVFLAEAPRKHAEGELAEFTAGIMSGLAKVGVGPLVFAGMAAPPVFGLVFGEDWVESGRMIAWMVPWFVLQFVSSPVSMVMHVLQRQREMLALTVFGLIVRVAPVLAAALAAPEYMVPAFATGSAIFYFVLSAIVLSRAGCGGGHVNLIAASALRSAVPGAAAGALTWMIFYLVEP